MYASAVIGIFLAARGTFAIPVAEPKPDKACPLTRSIQYSTCLYECRYPSRNQKTPETDANKFDKCTKE